MSFNGSTPVPSLITLYNSGNFKDLYSTAAEFASVTDGTATLSNGYLSDLLDPINSLDATNKQYVDNAVLNGPAGISIPWKITVKATSVSNVSLTSPPATIDGVTLATNDRVLLKDQNVASENGIYTYTFGAPSLLVRSSDAAVGVQASGTSVYSVAGTINQALFYFCNSASTSGTYAVLYGSSITYLQFGSVSAGGLNTNIQFNNTGLIDGSSNFTYDGTSVTVLPPILLKTNFIYSSNTSISASLYTNHIGSINIGSQTSTVAMDIEASSGIINMSASTISSKGLVKIIGTNSSTIGISPSSILLNAGSANISSLVGGSIILAPGKGSSGLIGSGIVYVGSSVNSTSITNGSLVISGGVGISGSAYIGLDAHILSTIDSTSITSGSLVLSGGLGLSGSVNIGSNVTILGTVDSTSSSTGSLVINGGLGLTKNIVTDSSITAHGQLVSTVSTGPPLVVTSSALVANLYASRSALTDTISILADNTNNSNVYPIWTTAAGNDTIYISNTKMFFNPASASLTLLGQLTSATINTSGSGTIGSLAVSSGAVVNGSLSSASLITGPITCTSSLITDTTTSSGTGTGALVVYGSVGIGGIINVSRVTGLAVPSVGSDAANKTYVDATTSALVAGSNTQIQYNNNGIFGASSAFVFNGTSVIVSTSTASLSSTTGSLIVYGGIGLTGSLYSQFVTANQIISTIGSGTPPFIVSSNTLVPNLFVETSSKSNNVYILDQTGTNAIFYPTFVSGMNYNQAYIGTSLVYNPRFGLTISNTTASVSQTSGALIVSGGIGVSGTINVTKVTGLATPVLSSDAVNKLYVDTVVGATVAGSNTQIQYNNNSLFGASANFVYNGTSVVIIGPASSSMTSGSLIVNGGLGITGQITASTVTGLITPTSATDAANKSYVDGPAHTVAGSDTQVQFNNAGSFGANANFIYDGTTVYMKSGAQSTNATTGTLVIQNGGGIGLSGSMYVGTSGRIYINNTVNTTSYTSGALVVSGSVGIARDVFIGSSLNVGVSLNVVGSGTIGTLIAPLANITSGSIGTLTSISGIISALTSTSSTISSLTVINENITNSTISSLNATSGTIGTLVSTSGIIGSLVSTVSTIGSLVSTVSTIGTLVSTLGIISTLVSTIGTISSLAVTNANITNSTVGTLTIINASITNGTIGTLVSTNTNITSGTISSLSISNNLYVGTSGTVYIQNTVNSTSIGTGSLILSGGLGVSGSIFATSYNTPSDIRYKNNINPIQNSLKLLTDINGYSYHFNGSNRLQYGVIAQEIEEIGLTNLVTTDPHNFYKSVNYIELIPIIIESIKELKNSVDFLINKTAY